MLFRGLNYSKVITGRGRTTCLSTAVCICSPQQRLLRPCLPRFPGAERSAPAPGALTPAAGPSRAFPRGGGLARLSVAERPPLRARPARGSRCAARPLRPPAAGCAGRSGAERRRRPEAAAVSGGPRGCCATAPGSPSPPPPPGGRAGTAAAPGGRCAGQRGGTAGGPRGEAAGSAPRLRPLWGWRRSASPALRLLAGGVFTRSSRKRLFARLC